MSKETRQGLLAALFSEAIKAGINSETLRNEVAPAVIGKRLSEAGPRDLMKMLDHVTRITDPKSQRWRSSHAGLVEEIKNLARARWGTEYEKPLRAFINSHGYKGTATDPSFMDIANLKAFKKRLIELNRQDGRTNG